MPFLVTRKVDSCDECYPEPIGICMSKEQAERIVEKKTSNLKRIKEIIRKRDELALEFYRKNSLINTKEFIEHNNLLLIDSRNRTFEEKTRFRQLSQILKNKRKDIDRRYAEIDKEFMDGISDYEKRLWREYDVYEVDYVYSYVAVPLLEE